MPKIFLLSAGHTNLPGQDRGAAGNGLIEGAEACIIRDEVAARLRTMGHSVREDGSDGDNKPLTHALTLIPGTDLAVEIHFNAAANPKATGVEVLAKPNRKADAKRIAKAISTALGLPLRGEGGYKSDSSGQHHRLAFCQKGGLIAEICFISNPQDVAIYNANKTKLFDNLALAVTGETEKPSESPQTPNQPLLKRGSKGDSVKFVQKKLTAIFNDLPKRFAIVADGDYGEKTEAAVRIFQRQNGLEADGIFGPKTWAKLLG